MLIPEEPLVSIRYPYRYKDSPFGRIPDPIITLSVSTWYGWRPFDFLVDSGADMTMVPKSFAEWVGVDLQRLPKFRSYGVEGLGLDVYHGELDVRMGRYDMRIPCLFSSREKTPLLLGRAGLFRHFTLIFENSDQSLIFRPID
jgi:hypothetical protein